MGKKIISYILAFAMSIGVFVVLALVILSNTIWNKQYVLDILEKNNYFEKTYANIQEGIDNYAMQSGLEQEVFENLYTQEKVIKDVSKAIDAIYDNKETRISGEEIEKELDNRINKVLEEHRKVPDQKEKESIQKLESVISETYVNGIVYSSEVVEKVSVVLQKTLPILQKLLMGSIAYVCVLLLIIGIISKKETFKYVGISFMTSGVLSVLLPFLVGDRSHYILILNASFSECVRSMLSAILQMFSIVGGILILLGIINCIVINYMNRVKTKEVELKSE